MADPACAAPVPLCASAALLEGGTAHVWDVLEFGRPVRAFALRFDGVVRAYLNRCLHVPMEMDWQPGRFLDSELRFIMCSIHGATYERLTALAVREQDGQVHWYPSHDIRPASPAAAGESPP